MAEKLVLLLMLLFSSYCMSQTITNDNIDVHDLTHENTIYKGNKNTLDIYCYNGTNYSIISSWRSIYVDLKSAKLDLTVFVGNNASEVKEQYEKHISSWFILFNWQKSAFSLPAFSKSCFGIFSHEDYTLELIFRHVNYWKIWILCFGIFVFYAAPALSRNVFFHYATGVSVGVLASLLIIVFLIYRIVPKKTTGIAFLTLGSSVVIYIFQLILDNARILLQGYSNYVFGYVVTAAAISFVICYRWGPVSEVRTLNLIRWTLQLVGILTMYFSSEARELNTAVIIVVLTIYNFPKKVLAKIRSYWMRRFPPKLKLLTEEEYITQANRETNKSLDELRKFCHSPDCNAWKIITRLKDPQRFASFVEGNSHLTDDEILKYDAESYAYPQSSDESDVLTEDETVIG